MSGRSGAIRSPIWRRCFSDNRQRRCALVANRGKRHSGGVRFAQKLPSPTLAFYEGEVHGFLTYPACFQAAADVVERIAAFLRAAVPDSTSAA